MYENARALGGHVSKSHKGQSAAYNSKMKVREKRQGLRIALGLAKMLFCKYSSLNITKERSHITKIRDIIHKSKPEACVDQD